MKNHFYSKNLKSANRQFMRGMTLIEILVVLAIVGLLAGLVGPRVMKYLDSSRTSAAKLQIKDIEKALDVYKLDTGRYPTTEEGLNALMTKPASANGWSGPYLTGAVPVDPWNNPYKYALSGGAVEITSLGSDNAVGGDGDKADVTNKQP